MAFRLSRTRPLWRRWKRNNGDRRLYTHGPAPLLQILYQRKLVKSERCAIWYIRKDIGLGLTALRAYEVSHDETFAKRYIPGTVSQPPVDLLDGPQLVVVRCTSVQCFVVISSDIGYHDIFVA